VTADPGVVFDASALVAYAQNDVLAMPVDELLRELREDTGGPVILPELAFTDAAAIVADDKAATARLESFAAAHGLIAAGPDVQDVVGVLVAQVGVSPGVAHAILLAAERGFPLATYAASTVGRTGFAPRLILDLDELFRI
jgi:hypothetical protein